MRLLWEKMIKYKLGIFMFLLILMASSYGLSLYFNKNKAVAVDQFVVAERSDILSSVSATGTIKPVNMVDISSKVTGLIKEVRVNENDTVVTDQILVTLDDKRIRAQVAQTSARLANAAANFERNKRLSAIGAVAQQQMDAASMDYDVAQAAYEDSLSQLDDTVIRAPLAGTIIGKPIPAGQTVSPGISTPMVLLTIADMSKMQIDTQVDESDIGKIAVGQKTTFSVDAFPERVFNGVVSNVSQKANIQQNVVYYNVTIDVTDVQNVLRPTMTARVSLLIAESKNTIVIPLAAVKNNKGKQYVQIMSDNKEAKTVPVVLGLAADDRVEVLSGIREGEKVVLPQTKTPSSGTAATTGGSLRGIMGR